MGSPMTLVEYMCLLRILCFVNFSWHLYSVNLASVVRWIVDSFWCWLLLAALPPISIKLIGLVTRLLAELNWHNLHRGQLFWTFSSDAMEVRHRNGRHLSRIHLFFSCMKPFLSSCSHSESQSANTTEDILEDKLFGRQDIFYCVWHGCEFQNCQYFTDSSLFSKLSPEPMHKHIVWCFCDQKIIFIYSSSHINHARRPADNAV